MISVKIWPGALVALGVFLAFVGTAHAVTVTETLGPGPADGFATSITYDSDIVAAGRGTANDRDDATNALGASNGDFFEIGLNDTVDFGFGSPFVGPGAMIEVTFGSRDNWEEYAIVQVGNAGDPGSFTAINENPISNQASGAIAFTFDGGPFDTVRLVSAAGTIEQSCGSGADSYQCGGFDVESIRVSLVPLPTPLALLILSVGGIGLLSYRGRARA